VKGPNYDSVMYYVVGSTDTTMLVVFLFFSFLGATISLLVETKYRKTGAPYSFWYMLEDNAKRMVVTALLIIASLSLGTQLFGFELNIWWAFLIGFSNDKVSEKLKVLKRKLATKPEKGDK